MRGRLEEVQEVVEESLATGEMKGGETALPGSGWPFALHQSGLLFKNSQRGVGKKPRFSVSQKEAEQGFLCLL